MSRMKSPGSPMMSSQAALLFTLGGSIQVLLLLGLGFVARLKEQPMFWLNIGGWPVWLREMVQIFFYPLLGMELFALLLFSPATAHWISHGRLCPGTGMTMVLLGRFLSKNIPACWSVRPPSVLRQPAHSGIFFSGNRLIWDLTIAVVVIVVANNLINLIDGRSWHWHSRWRRLPGCRSLREELQGSRDCRGNGGRIWNFG